MSKARSSVKRKPRLTAKTVEAIYGYAFILPNFIGFLIFTLLAVFASLGLSFFQWDILTPPRFIGLDNFVKLLGFYKNEGHWYARDPLFWRYLYNTIFMMATIPLNMLISLLLAVALKKKRTGTTIFRTIYFLPTICSGIATCYLWKWLYSSDFGLINYLITRAGDLFGQHWTGPAWLTSPTWAKPALMIMGTWTALGGTNLLLYLAALQGIPQHLYEAARIDGAGWLNEFRHITWPMVTPVSFFILIMSIIWGFQGSFMTLLTITEGGPAGATTTTEFYIYQNAFEQFRMGYASAIAWVLFAIIFVVTFANWRLGGRHVTY